MTDPWTILGWLLVGLVLTPVALFVARFVAAVVQDARKARKHRRANAGKLRCEEPECKRIAVRRTPRGYYCEDHWPPKSRWHSIGFAMLLDHARPKD